MQSHKKKLHKKTKNHCKKNIEYIFLVWGYKFVHKSKSNKIQEII